MEDLWDLPLTSTTGKVNLDQLAITAYRGIEQAPTVSFVSSASKTTKQTVDELRLEILKYVIEVKQSENATKVAASAKADEKRKLIELLGRKKDQALEQLSEEDLVARINAL